MSRRQLVFILCACVNFTTFLCVSAQLHKSNNGSNNNINYMPAYAIASIASGLLNSTLCENELLNFRDAVDQRILWSLKMLDSSGEFPSSFLYGNNYWMGSRSQCIDTMSTVPLQISKRILLNNTLYRDPQKEIPPFKVNYFAAHFKHNSTLQYHMEVFNEDVITLGLCLPASCSEDDVSFILERIFRDRILLISDIYSADFKLIQVKNLINDYKWLTSGAMPFICVSLVLSVLMVIIGTTYDIFINKKCSNKENKNDINGKNTISTQQMEMEVTSQESRLGKIIICFSAYTNTKIIFNEKHDGSMPVIHGLRFLSMCWVIMGHILLFGIDYIDNKLWILKIGGRFINHLISTTPLAVDTFFLLSGLLVTYTYINNKKDRDRIQSLTYRAKINEFFIIVIKRYIRLTPAYITVLAISHLISTWLDETSPFYVHESLHESCSKYWWRNLLYINNLFSFETMCMKWSWYLSVDMQCYIIAVVLLILLTMYFYITVTILSALLIGSVVLTGYLSYINEYTITLDELYRLVDVLYLPTWVRISPYIIGMITGYILTQLNGKLVLKKRTVILCWCLGSACNIIALFSIYNQQIPILASAIYTALYRCVWTIGIAWIIIACLTQHGGIVQKLLSYKGWIPFSRLCYCGYLLNPIIILSFGQLSEKSLHIEFTSLTVLYIGIFIIIYLCSYILSLVVEIPYILLGRKII